MKDVPVGDKSLVFPICLSKDVFYGFFSIRKSNRLQRDDPLEILVNFIKEEPGFVLVVLAQTEGV